MQRTEENLVLASCFSTPQPFWAVGCEMLDFYDKSFNLQKRLSARRELCAALSLLCCCTAKRNENTKTNGQKGVYGDTDTSLFGPHWVEPPAHRRTGWMFWPLNVDIQGYSYSAENLSFQYSPVVCSLVHHLCSGLTEKWSFMQMGKRNSSRNTNTDCSKHFENDWSHPADLWCGSIFKACCELRDLK